MIEQRETEKWHGQMSYRDVYWSRRWLQIHEVWWQRQKGRS